MNSSISQDKRFWLAGTAVLVLILVAASWLILIKPTLSSASSLRDRADAVGYERVTLQAKTDKLKEQAGDPSALIAGLRKALAALPSGSGLPAFTDQLTSQANAAGVAVDSIVVSTIASVSAATPPATTDTSTSDTSTTDTSTTSGTSVTTAAGALYTIPVTIITQGPLVEQLLFLKAIETQGARRALITSTQFAAASTSRVNSIDAGNRLTTEITVFSAPQSPAQIARYNQLLSGHVGN